MKKLFFTILSLLLIVSFVFVGCKNPYMPDAPDETPSTQTTYTVKFFYQDETSAGNDVKGQAGQTVNLPTLKEKNGKIFSGWYLTKSVTGTAISQDLTGGKYTISVTDASSDKVISLYAIYIDSSSAVQVESISVNPATVTLQVGGYQQLSVIYNPSNANVGKSVTWNSSNESVAAVDANGLVKACAIGNSTITATIANGKTATVKVIVSSKEKVLKKLTLSKISDTSFTAIAKYDDNTTEDVTSQAVWTSKNTTVATVDSGIVQILKAGTTNIFASYTYKNVTKTA